MIALDLNVALGLGLFALASALWLAAWLDRRLAPPVLPGTSPTELEARAAGAPIGIALVDAAGAIRFANGPARHSLELDADQRLPDRAWVGPWREDLAALRGPDPVNPYRVINAGSDAAFSWWLCPFGDLALVLTQELGQAARGERVARTFLADLSHELRTPLTAILAHLELLRDPGLPEATHDTSLRLVHQEATRISRLVQDLLTLSRIEAVAEFDLRAADMLVVAETAIADVILEAERRGIAIDLEARRPLPRAVADPDRLRQVFINLLDNAVKYGEPGRRVRLTLTPAQTALNIAVTDDGPGIAPEHLPHLTRRFYRARPDGAGSGLGLAIVDEILRRHNTQLVLVSPPPGEVSGLQASFTLPVVEPPGEAPHA